MQIRTPRANRRHGRGKNAAPRRGGDTRSGARRAERRRARGEDRYARRGPRLSGPRLSSAAFPWPQRSSRFCRSLKVSMLCQKLSCVLAISRRFWMRRANGSEPLVSSASPRRGERSCEQPRTRDASSRSPGSRRPPSFGNGSISGTFGPRRPQSASSRAHGQSGWCGLPAILFGSHRLVPSAS